MRAVIALPPSAITISEINDVAAKHRYLVNVGTLRMSARAGDSSVEFGNGSTSQLDLTFSNEGKRFATLTGSPFRTRVDVYDDDGALFFAGLVALIAFGRQIVWTLKS